MLITTTMIYHGDPKSQRSMNQVARMTMREREERVRELKSEVETDLRERKRENLKYNKKRLAKSSNLL